MKFAVFTASTPDWTPEETVTELAAQGWDGVEWRVVDQKPPQGKTGFWAGNKATWPASTFVEDAPRIKELTEGAGLAMPSIGAYASCEQPEEVDRLMRGVAALGVPQMRVTVGGKPGPEGYRATFERRRAQYADIEQLAAKHGVRALVEIHHQSIVASPSAAVRFVEGRDPAHVGVIHDIGNMMYEGYEYNPWALDMLGDHLAHVHVKNAAPQQVDGPSNRTTWKWGWATLRHGVADMPGLFQALREIGYDKWVSVEDFSSEVPLRERVADNLAYLRELATL